VLMVATSVLELWLLGIFFVHYITKQLSENVLARLEAVAFPFSGKGEMIFVIPIFIIVI
jgi:hypothetical protein